MCRRFDTIPACDGRTDGQIDGIAIASTALAMRRAVKTENVVSLKIVYYIICLFNADVSECSINFL